MTMYMSYAGVPLLLDDPGGEIGSWVSRYLSYEDMRYFAWQSPYVEDGRVRPRRMHRQAVGLGTPNFPPPPRPKINTLYWPTFASRWSVGFFMVDFEGLRNIQHATGSGENKAEFRVLDPYGWPLIHSSEAIGAAATVVDFTTELYMLAPKAITINKVWGNDTWLHHGTATVLSEPGVSPVYLLPLVDERYFWHSDNMGEMTDDHVISWNALLDRCGIVISNTPERTPIESVYLKPDKIEALREYGSPAVLIDAALESVGRRHVTQVDNKCQALTWDKYRKRLGKNLRAVGETSYGTDRIAGEFFVVEDSEDQLPESGLHTRELEPGIPEFVEMVCPKFIGEHPDPSGGVLAISKGSADYTDQECQVGTTWTIFTTAHADFSTGEDDPDNNAELHALAVQLTKDVVKQREAVYDLAIKGVPSTTDDYFSYILTGYDNFAWFHFGHQHEPGTYDVFTRVQSFPPGFGVTEMLHQRAESGVGEASIYLPDWSKSEVVKIADGDANSDDYHAGFVRRWATDESEFEDKENVWVRVVDRHHAEEGDVTLVDNDWHIGLHIGAATTGGYTRPLYAVKARHGYKQWCNFILEDELTREDADQDATIESQWGLGIDNEEEITVHNMGTSEALTYLFSGDSGDKGLAAWRGDGANYVIIQMECP